MINVYLENSVGNRVQICPGSSPSHRACFSEAGESSTKPTAVTSGTHQAQSEELAALTRQIASLEKRESRYFSCTLNPSIVGQYPCTLLSETLVSDCFVMKDFCFEISSNSL